MIEEKPEYVPQEAWDAYRLRFSIILMSNKLNPKPMTEHEKLQKIEQFIEDTDPLFYSGSAADFWERFTCHDYSKGPFNYSSLIGAVIIAQTDFINLFDTVKAENKKIKEAISTLTKLKSILSDLTYVEGIDNLKEATASTLDELESFFVHAKSGDFSDDYFTALLASSKYQRTERKHIHFIRYLDTHFQIFFDHLTQTSRYKLIEAMCTCYSQFLGNRYFDIDEIRIITKRRMPASLKEK